MFGMGIQEILLIAVIAVLVIGPEQLPSVARTIGRMLAQFKRATNDLRSAVSEEFQQHEELKDLSEFQRELDSEVRGITGAAQDYVEREMEKEERELDRLEKEVSESDGDPGPLGDPEPAHQPGPGDFPDEREQQAIAGDAAEGDEKEPSQKESA